MTYPQIQPPWTQTPRPIQTIQTIQTIRKTPDDDPGDMDDGEPDDDGIGSTIDFENDLRFVPCIETGRSPFCDSEVQDDANGRPVIPEGEFECQAAFGSNPTADYGGPELTAVCGFEKCLPGTRRPSLEARLCEGQLCDEDERVLDHACTPCPDGQRNSAGDNTGGPTTLCDGINEDPCAGLGPSCATLDHLYFKASNTDPNDSFGYAIASDGDTLVVSARNEAGAGTLINSDDEDDENGGTPLSGAVYVFVRSSSGAWSQQAYIKPPNPQETYYFGHAVALQGDTLVVSAVFESSEGPLPDEGTLSRSGAIYVYTRAGTVWNYRAFIKASNADEDDRFGHALAIDGDQLAVAALYESGRAGSPALNDQSRSGAVYIFQGGGASWNEVAYLKAPNASDNDWFGSSVDLEDGVLAVGAPREASSDRGVFAPDGANFGDDDDTERSGAVYVFSGSGSNWVLDAFIKASDATAASEFGAAVALGEGRLVVGAPQTAIEGVPRNGVVYVFEGGGRSWTEAARLTAPSPDRSDVFGFAVAIDGDMIYAGAPFDDADGRGAEGDPQTNGEDDSGAIFAFDAATGYRYLGMLKAPNSDEDDLFGSVIVPGDDAIYVASTRESSSATGVQGDTTLNDAANSGAVFRLVPEFNTPVSETTYIRPDTRRSRFGHRIVADGDTLVAGSLSKTVAIYRERAGQWSLEHEIRRGGLEPTLWGFHGLDVHGDAIAIGDISDSSSQFGVDPDGEPNDLRGGSGAVYIWERGDTGWSQTHYIKAENVFEGAKFGWNVILGDEALAIGAEQDKRPGIGASPYGRDFSNSMEQSPTGAVYLYRRDGDTWVPDTYIKPEDRTGLGSPDVRLSSKLGTVMDMENDDRLAIGIPIRTSDTSGDVYIYARGVSGWTLQQTLEPPADLFPLVRNFGARVSFDPSGRRLVVTASGVLNHLLIIVYEEIAGQWVVASSFDTERRIEPSPWFTNRTVVLSGEYLLVGDASDSSAASGINGDQDDTSVEEAGAAYLYRRVNGQWQLDSYHKAPFPGEGDRFGDHVDLFGRRLFISAPSQGGEAFGINPEWPPIHQVYDRVGAVYVRTF